MLKNFQNFKESASGLAIDARILEFLIFFLSITVFRKFQVWKFWNFLSITVFRGLNLTKHCNAQKNQLFTA